MGIFDDLRDNLKLLVSNPGQFKQGAKLGAQYRVEQVKAIPKQAAQSRFNLPAQIQAVRSMNPQQAQQFRQQAEAFRSYLPQVPKFNIKNPIGNFAANLPGTIVESTVNAIPNAAISLAQLPAARNKKQVASDLASIAEAPLTLATLGLTSASKKIALQAGRQTFKQAVGQGVKTGVKYGTTFGLTQGLKSGGNMTNDLDYARNVLTNTVTGGLTGGVLGAGLSGGSNLAGNFWRGLVTKAPGNSDLEKSKFAQKFIRDEIGRFAKGGKKTPNEPVWVGDMRESLGLPRNGNYSESEFVQTLKREEGFIRIPGGKKPKVSKVAQPPLSGVAKKVEADNIFLESNRGKTIDGLTIPKDYTAYRRTITGDTVDVNRLKSDPAYFKQAYESTFAKGFSTDEKLYKTLTKTLVPKDREASGYLADLYTKAKSPTSQPVSADDISFSSPPAMSLTQKAPMQSQALGQLKNTKLGSEDVSSNNFALNTLEVAPSGRTPAQQADLTTTPKLSPVQSGANLESTGGGVGNPSSGDIIDPVQRLLQAIKQAKPVRGEQEALYRAERARRAGAVAGVGRNVPGEKGFYAQLGQLKGELPKVQFESIRKELSQSNVDTLFNKVEQVAYLSPFEKVTAKGGLAKLIGAEGGTVPTKGELSLLKEIYGQEFVEAILEKRPLFDKVLANLGDALNIPRAIMATADLSAPLRQGVVLIGRPKQWGPAFASMFKYAFSEKAYQGLMDDIKVRPTYPAMRQAKLSLTEMGSDLAAREETFMSNLVDKVPGLNVVTKASNRAYSGFLNKLRADTFDDLVKTAKKEGIDRPGLEDDIAKFVNSATGRGDLGALNKAAVVMNGVFFSPRLLASRINLLNPVYYAKLDPFVRKEALKSMLTFAGTGLSILGLAKLGGADVGTDPRSADFGKIKVGDTRYDIWGGFQQYFRLAGQLISGQIVNSSTGQITTLGEGYRPLNRFEVAQRFLEGKENPVASFISGALKGQDALGKDFDYKKEIIERFIPILLKDVQEIMTEEGPASGGKFLPGVFGVGVQNYGPPEGSAYAYYRKFSQMPPEQANAEAAKLKESDPNVYSQLKRIVKQQKAGLTPEDVALGDYGVQTGERARKIAAFVNKLKTPEEKNAYIKKLQDGGVITDDVYEQLKGIFKK